MVSFHGETGGPGCGKATQCKKITDRYPGWVHISIGDTLRREIMAQGSANDQWGMVSTLVEKGEMAPEVGFF
jgi:adenylate kinase